MPARKNTQSASEYLEEARKLSGEIEGLRLDVARLDGRLDAIEAFLKFDIKTWEPTEAQKKFAEDRRIQIPSSIEGEM